MPLLNGAVRSRDFTTRYSVVGGLGPTLPDDASIFYTTQGVVRREAVAPATISLYTPGKASG